MDIAIQYQKIDLGFGRFIFKPVGIIKGTFQNETDTFVNEYGYVLCGIGVYDYDTDSYFSNVTNLEELKKYFGKDLDDVELVQEFYDSNINLVYIGLYNETSEMIDVLGINFDDIEEVDNSIDSNEIPELEVNLSNLETAVDSDDKEQMKKCLQRIIGSVKTLMNDNKKTLVESQSDKTQNNSSVQNDYDLDLTALQNEVLSKIIGQDKAVKTVTTRIVKNYLAVDKEDKSHILIMGPTGTGKTAMIQIACDYLKIPCKSFDATSFTQEGYVGNDVQEMLLGLIDICNGDIKKAENGIIILNEIDKKCDKKSDESVATTSVQNALLKILGRDKFQIVKKDLMGVEKFIDFDTSNLTVVLTGAFENIKKNSTLSNKKVIGFGSVQSKVNNDSSEITQEDLINYGMIPELAGRIDCIAQTNQFEIEDFINIIYKSKNSALKSAKRFYENRGIKFLFSAPYVREIAKNAKLYNSGARGIKKAVMKSLEVVEDYALRKENKVKKIKLTKSTAIDNKKYYVE